MQLQWAEKQTPVQLPSAHETVSGHGKYPFSETPNLLTLETAFCVSVVAVHSCRLLAAMPERRLLIYYGVKLTQKRRDGLVCAIRIIQSDATGTGFRRFDVGSFPVRTGYASDWVFDCGPPRRY